MTIPSREYYDDFARSYDAGRGHAYHRLVDALALRELTPLVRDRDVVEVGAGTGLLLLGLTGLARRVVGVDLSREMLRRARQRRLPVVQGRAEALPLPDASVDVAACFKVFAHLPDPHQALAEMARVVRPGGRVVVELYNPVSLRGLARRLGPARATSARHSEHDVFTRFDTLEDLRRVLPPGLTVERVRGIRLLTPAGRLLQLPVLGRLLAGAESLGARLPGVWRLAGFVVVVLTREVDHGPS
jgi:ubiquinone/menaquinone biosynthesis C-methylase UbiE